MLDRRQAAIALAGCITFINLYSPQALLPLLSQQLGAGASAVSLLVSATTLAIALIAPFTGTVADVVGRKRVIVSAMFALVLPTALLGLAGGLDAMVLWRFVQGLLLPPIFAVTIAYIGDELPAAEATSATGIYLSASSFGGFLGRFLPGLLAGPIGWRGAFLSLAVITLAAALGVLWLLPRERRFVRSPGLAASARQMLRHLADPRLVATYAVGFGVLFTFIASFTYVNFHLAAAPFNLSPAALGGIFVVYLVGVVTTLLTGRAVARFGRRKLVIGLVALWAAGMLLTLLPSLAAILVGLAMSAGCGFVCQAVATGFVAVTAREGRSSAVGLYVTCYYIGGSVGGVLPGFAFERFGWPGAVATVLSMLALVAGFVAAFWRDGAAISAASAR
ncbi:MAG TPA: MFS transporter [Stellaceae bacterium]|nr:MFS transporter [Stellaceae bacterium]